MFLLKNNVIKDYAFMFLDYCCLDYAFKGLVVLCDDILCDGICLMLFTCYLLVGLCLMA